MLQDSVTIIEFGALLDAILLPVRRVLLHNLLSSCSHDYISRLENNLAASLILSLSNPQCVLTRTKLVHLDSFVPSVEYLSLVPIPYVIQHGVSSVRHECSYELKRRYFLTILKHTLNHFRIFSEILELW